MRHAGSGWDNELWRLGDDLVVRLPRRALGATLVEHEQRWLPQLADRLGVPVPVPRHLGEPAPGYPWRWHVAPWLPGSTADRRPLSAAGARRLGAVLARLHVAAPPDAPANPHRDGHVARRPAPLPLLAAAGGPAPGTDTGALARVWERACAAPPAPGCHWIHGDVHVRNVLTGPDGDLAAVLDWGDLCAGDPAVDLSARWTTVPAAHEAAFLAAYGPVDPALEDRARGWALVFATIVHVAHRDDDPAFAAVARATLTRLAAARD
ncbi:phosphotransferase [Paraconexibacter algicola]|uniref:phosphotransferase n=1 Tax=Paraconexibacter algicola TaxID=2133960 RepID=UPI002545F22D|nr:phosphotransferase [Paraconexibacter algicola]